MSAGADRPHGSLQSPGAQSRGGHDGQGTLRGFWGPLGQKAPKSLSWFPGGVTTEHGCVPARRALRQPLVPIPRELGAGPEQGAEAAAVSRVRKATLGAKA